MSRNQTSILEHREYHGFVFISIPSFVHQHFFLLLIPACAWTLVEDIAQLQKYSGSLHL